MGLDPFMIMKIHNLVRILKLWTTVKDRKNVNLNLTGSILKHGLHTRPFYIYL